MEHEPKPIPPPTKITHYISQVEEGCTKSDQPRTINKHNYFYTNILSNLRVVKPFDVHEFLMYFNITNTYMHNKEYIF